MGRRRTSAVVVAICLSLACLMSASGFLSPSPARSAIGRGSTTRRNSAAVRMMASKKDEVEVPDRLLSVVPYALPFFDGLDYGEGLFRVVPELREAVYAVFGSCLGIWHDLPFASFVYFLIVTVLARNPNLPRFIRFNMQQAVLLDVGLIVFGLVEGAVKFVSPGGAEPLDNFIFYCIIASCAYAVVQNLRGREPNDIPVISEAAWMQIGPF